MIQDIPQVQDIGLDVDGSQDGNRTMSNQASCGNTEYNSANILLVVY
jgi:hypothetical protein